MRTIVLDHEVQPGLAGAMVLQPDGTGTLDPAVAPADTFRPAPEAVAAKEPTTDVVCGADRSFLSRPADIADLLASLSA